MAIDKKKYILKWKKEARDYTAKFKSVYRKINPKYFKRTQRVLGTKENMLHNMIDIKKCLVEIDQDIKDVMVNIEIEHPMKSYDKKTITMSTKDAVNISIMIIDKIFPSYYSGRVFSDTMLFHKFRRSKHPEQAIRNISRLYELRERKGNTALSFVYQVYRSLPEIIRKGSD